MKTQIEFNKALRFLDCGKTERAIEILQEVITNSQNEENDLSFISSNCVLGELYFDSNNFDKAKFHLETALSAMNNCSLDEDLFDYEKSCAMKILTDLKSKD